MNVNGKMNSRVKKIPFTFTREGKIQIPGQIRMKIDAFAMNVNSRSKRKKNENLKITIFLLGFPH